MQMFLTQSFVCLKIYYKIDINIYRVANVTILHINNIAFLNKKEINNVYGFKILIYTWLFFNYRNKYTLITIADSYNILAVPM